MVRAVSHFLKMCLTVCAALLCAGCPETEQAPAEAPLIQAGESVMTAAAFNEAFEVEKGAYPHHLVRNPEYMKQAKLHFLKQAVDRTILMERARELHIAVAQDELEQAAAKVKKDYPDGEFDRMIVETGISYAAWENELRVRLLMEKVVKEDLEQQISITPDDIVAYYKTYVEETDAPEAEIRENAVDEKVIRYIRRKKAEAAYGAWLDGLREKYSIRINDDKLKKIMEL